MKPAPAAWQQAGSILAVRLDTFGDVLMTTPALAALAGGGDRQVTLLASEAGAAVARYVPPLADVITYRAPWVSQVEHGGSSDHALLSAWAKRRFDAAIIFTVCTQSALAAALMCRMAGIPLRLAHSRENPYELLTNWAPESDVCRPGMRHEVQRQLDLVASVGFGSADDKLVFACRPEDRETARVKLTLAGGRVGRPTIVVHPGSSAPSRRYPAERFGAAAQRLAVACGAQIVFVGGDGDIDACAAAQRTMVLPSVSLAGRLSLGELGALIADARLLVCNNSGPSHLAAAVGTPVVVLYALTNPQHTPWRVPCRVLSREVPCRDCLKSVCPAGHHACLLGVEPKDVADVALELWHEAEAGPSRDTRRALHAA